MQPPGPTTLPGAALWLQEGFRTIATFETPHEMEMEKMSAALLEIAYADAGLHPNERLHRHHEGAHDSPTSSAASGLQFDLCPARVAAVEMPVGVEHLFHLDDLGQDPGRIDGAGPDEFDQMRRIAPMIAVAHLDRQVLFHGLSARTDVQRLRIHADDRQRAG